MKIKLLSLVVPAFKQEKTIVKDLKNISKALEAQPFDYELIVVVDGYVDKTRQKVNSLRNKNIKVIGYEKNMGKGFAIRLGVEKAAGDIIGFIDAGMDIEPKSIHKLLLDMEEGNYDIAIGSKLHPESNVKYPFVRKLLSGGYRNITHLLFGLNIRDTQAGLKLYRRDIANKIFKSSTINDFAFDIETLVLAHMLGFKKIYEGPIKLNFKKNTITNINFIFVAIKMLFETLIVFFKLKFNMYRTLK